MVINSNVLRDTKGDSYYDLESYSVVAFIDVDGTMTDGMVYINGDGQQTRRYFTRDSNGVETAVSRGIFPILISSTKNGGIDHRANTLSVPYFHSMDKLATAQEIMAFFPESTIMVTMGDDINDLELMEASRFAACPSDAAREVRNIVRERYKQKTGRILPKRGGKGAVRLFLDLVYRYYIN